MQLAGREKTHSDHKRDWKSALHSKAITSSNHGAGWRVGSSTFVRKLWGSVLLGVIAVFVSHSAARAEDFVVTTNSTTQNDGHVIDGNDSLTINAGASITSAGLIVPAVRSTGASDTIVNLGTLSTLGDGAHAIFSNGTNVTINSSGTLSTIGDTSFGIMSFGANATITNSGAISTSGPAAYGILSFGASSFVTNSGTISTVGALSHGVVSQGDNSTVSNSGKVVAAAGFSFHFTGANPILNLMAPSFIGGAFSTPINTTLNITTGPSHSVLWTFDPADLVGGAPTVTGTVPAFFDAGTGQFATYDPTGLAAAVDQLGERSSQISDLAARKSGESDIWFSGFGGLSSVDGNGSTLSRGVANLGLAVGANVQINNDFRFGAMVGYVAGVTGGSRTWTQSFDNRSDGLFANAHGQVDFDAFYIGFGLSGGAASHNDRRFVNDNLAPTNGQTLGQSWSTASYNSWWGSPEITLGVNMDGPDGWTLTPSAQLRYAFEGISGFTETGSNANAAVGARNLGMGEARLELAATKQFDMYKLTLRAGAQGRTSLGGSGADVTLLGITQAVSSGSENQIAAYMGADASFALNDTAMFDINTKLLIGNNIKSAAASATLSNSF